MEQRGPVAEVVIRGHLWKQLLRSAFPDLVSANKNAAGSIPARTTKKAITFGGGLLTTHCNNQ